MLKNDQQPDRLCSSENSLLVVIDIQERLTAAMPARVLERLKHNSTILLKAADHLSIPVLATLQYPKGLGPMIPSVSDLLPADAHTFDKTCFSCLDAEDFRQKLDKSGRKQVILLGVEAHICVLQTAIRLQDAGYQVFVAMDAICSRHRENYENALVRLQQAGITTSNTESIVYEWLRDARHEHFKTISALIK